MPETIRGKYRSTFFLAPPGLFLGNRTAQSKGKGHFSPAPPSTLPHLVPPSSDNSSHWATGLSPGLSELSEQSGAHQAPPLEVTPRLWAFGKNAPGMLSQAKTVLSAPTPPLQVFGKLGEGRQDPRLGCEEG